MSMLVDLLIDGLIRVLIALARLVGMAWLGIVLVVSEAARKGRRIFNREHRQERKLVRRRVAEVRAAEDAGGMVSVLCDLPRDEDYRSLRIGILRDLGRMGGPTGNSALVAAIGDCEDAWVSLAALDVIAKLRSINLRGAVAAAEGDFRPGVAKYARWVGERLDKQRRLDDQRR